MGAEAQRPEGNPLTAKPGLQVRPKLMRLGDCTRRRWFQGEAGTPVGEVPSLDQSGHRGQREDHRQEDRVDSLEGGTQAVAKPPLRAKPDPEPHR